MTPFVLSALAGLLCLPATYSLSREGSTLFALMVVALVGAAGGAAAGSQQRQEIGLRPWALILTFITGALVSEVVAFTRYYTSVGYQDSKLGVGVGISVVEFVVISVIGCIALLVAASATHSHINRRSKGHGADSARPS